MNNNIFIKKKNNTKFNPDVDYIYNKQTNERNNNIKPENLPFKPIIENTINKPIDKITINDLIISLDDNNIDIDKKYSAINNSRQDLDTLLKCKYNDNNKDDFIEQFEDKIVKLNLLSIQNDNFNEVKKESTEFFDDLQRKIQKDKNELDELIKNLNK